MTRCFPLIPFLTLFFPSCHDEAPDASVNPNPAPGAMERVEERVVDLENELVRERNARLERETEQRGLLLQIRNLVERRDEILVEEGETPEPGPAEKVGVSAIKQVEREAAVDGAEAREMARLQAVGETYHQLTTLSGEVYEGLEITEVTDLGVIFRHRTGVARIPFSDLPKEWGKRFFHDPARAKKAARSERLAQARRDQSIAREMAALKERAEKEAADARLALLAEAVDALRRRENERDANRFIAAGAFSNPPLFAPNQFGFWDGFFCPPFVQPRVVHPPVIRNSHPPQTIIRNNQGGGVRLGSAEVCRQQIPQVPAASRSRPALRRVTPLVTRPYPRARTSSAVSRPRTIVVPRTSTRTVRPATPSRSDGSSRVIRRTR